MINIRVSMAGQDVILRKIGALASAVKDLRPAWKNVFAFMDKYELNVFKSGGSFDGMAGWAPRKDGSFAWKRKGGATGGNTWGKKFSVSKHGGLFQSIKRADKGHGILVDSGRLMNSLAVSSSSDAIREMDAKWMVYGTSVPYAGYHQTGTRKMVARPPLRLTESAKRQITQIVVLHMRKTGQFVRESL
jgi:phage gpG-like protein